MRLHDAHLSWLFSCIGLCLALQLTLGTCLAGWADRVPTPINLQDSPGTANDHYNSGGRRIVRINNAIIAITPTASGTEHTYRSTNDGASWTRIDTDGVYSGCLISGPNNFVYHFYVSGDNIYMVKFLYDQTPTAPVIIYSDPNISERGAGAYNMLNATVDRDGILYVSTHWPHVTGEKDSLHIIRSEDAGTTWTPPGYAHILKRGDASYLWTYVHLDFTTDNVLVAVYHASFSPTNPLEFAKSTDKGETWARTQLSPNSIANPAVLTAGSETVYVFAQSTPGRGLVFDKSSDLGQTWSGWSVIDGTSLSGYADPSPGLGSDGTIYVAYRSGARSDLGGVYGGNALRERLAMTADGGAHWQFVDDYFYTAAGNPTERTGCRSQIRYQTWWNYGGPLEWIWMQYVNNGSQHPIYYDVNNEIRIRTSGALLAPTMLRISPASVY